MFSSDNYENNHTLECARMAAGAATTAVDAVCNEKVSSAFVLSRPPGHHATRDQPQGFCFFNNAAIAARYAQEKYNIRRVCVFDWDVHHGNGT